MTRKGLQSRRECAKNSRTKKRVLGFLVGIYLVPRLRLSAIPSFVMTSRHVGHPVIEVCRMAVRRQWELRGHVNYTRYHVASSNLPPLARRRRQLYDDRFHELQSGANVRTSNALLPRVISVCLEHPGPIEQIRYGPDPYSSGINLGCILLYLLYMTSNSRLI